MQPHILATGILVGTIRCAKKTARTAIKVTTDCQLLITDGTVDENSADYINDKVDEG